jgi:hypothetical protein
VNEKTGSFFALVMALRELLNKYKPPLPRFDHFNIGVHGVRTTDRQLHRIADIRFSPEGIYCELDESESCGHTEFALTVPEIKEIIRNKRIEGWKLPTSKRSWRSNWKSTWFIFWLGFE